MAGWTGLEPAASCVTGRRYNQLNYHPALKERTLYRQILTVVSKLLGLHKQSKETRRL